jgi:hypothetical protein
MSTIALRRPFSHAWVNSCPRKRTATARVVRVRCNFQAGVKICRENHPRNAREAELRLQSRDMSNSSRYPPAFGRVYRSFYVRLGAAVYKMLDMDFQERPF